MKRKASLDVSCLECPAPLESILENLDKLNPGQFLHVLHRRRPDLLYPLLEKRGFCHLARMLGNASCEILIWPQDDAMARRAAQTFLANADSAE